MLPPVFESGRAAEVHLGGGGEPTMAGLVSLERNGEAMRSLDPAKLDRELMAELIDEYGNKWLKDKKAEIMESYSTRGPALDPTRESAYRALAERWVQTNDTLRSVIWRWPAWLAGCEGGARPLCLVDLGASAGLNLRWDHNAAADS